MTTSADAFLQLLDEDLKTVRATYVLAQPKSRLFVIAQRLQRAEHEVGPTRVVTCVSAVEGLARALVIHHGNCTANEVHAAYTKWKLKGPGDLVTQALKDLGLSMPAVQFADSWPVFERAVLFRHLIVHECTYVGQDKYPGLIDACMLVFKELVHLAGLKDPTPVGGWPS